MITKIGLNNRFQKFILKTKDKTFLDKINRTLPLYESAFATSCYLIANETNKNIPKERKASLNYQTLIGGGVSVFLSKGIDNFANKHKHKICEELEKLNIKDSKKIITGTKIAIPLLITTIVSRYFLSTLSVPLANLFAFLQRKNKNKDT